MRTISLLEISKMSANLKRFVVFVILLLPQNLAVGEERQNPPTISISVSDQVHYGREHFPSDTYHTIDVTWKTNNASSVEILRGPGGEVGPEGTISLNPGNYIFIASGAGGIAVKPLSGIVTSRPGTGLDGLFYGLKSDFDPKTFESYSYKTSVNLRSDLDGAKREIVNHLQFLGYNAADESLNVPNGIFIYTPNYNESTLLEQSAEDRIRNGQLRRQAAITIMLRPVDKPPQGGTYDLYVFALVQRNRPRQDNKWTRDPDGFQVALPLCRTIADAIVSKVRR